jgi:hypothetical protein
MRSRSCGFVVTKELMKTASCMFLLILASTFRVSAQQVSQSVNVRDSSLILDESNSRHTAFGLGDLASPAETVSVRQTKSPAKAVLFSALVPGLGQIYTKSYWTLPIIWGLGAYYIHEWIKNNNQYSVYRDQYFNSINPSNPLGDLEIKNLRDFYRDQRDSYAVYFGIVYLANLVHAFVAASLYDFDVSDDLSLQIGHGGQMLTLRWRW